MEDGKPDVPTREEDVAKEEPTNGSESARESSEDSADKTQVKVSISDSGKGGKLSPIILIAAIIILAIAGYVIYGQLQPKMEVVTVSSLKKAIAIDELSSAEFVYNGIAVKKKGDSDKVDFRVAYDATVKAGIRMSDIDFEIDEAEKTVKPILPEVVINDVAVDVSNVDYMPANPNTDLKEIFALCEEDAQHEANHASDLQSVARDNLKSAIEALTKPILESGGYTLVWEEPASQLIEDAEAAAQDSSSTDGEEGE